MQQVKRRGAPLGNFNALKTGKYSPRKRAERRAAREASLAEERRRAAEWAATVPQTDYVSICLGLAAEKARRAGGLH
jgi:hypothetical protein